MASVVNRRPFCHRPRGIGTFVLALGILTIDFLYMRPNKPTKLPETQVERKRKSIITTPPKSQDKSAVSTRLGEAVQQQTSNYNNKKVYRPRANSVKRHSSLPDRKFTRDPQWWIPYVDELATPWKAWNVASETGGTGNAKEGKDDPFGWCVISPDEENHQGNKSHVGLYFVKVPKSASSTCAAVSIQLAYNIAQRRRQQEQLRSSNHHDQDDHQLDGSGGNGPCVHQFHHGKQYTNRQPPFFLWTVVRQPVSRGLSFYFFKLVSRQHRTPSPRSMIAFLGSTKSSQLEYISATRKPRQLDSATEDNVIEILKDDVLQSYHYIAVAERMDESLVVMRLLFDFDPIDMIVLSSKTSGGYDDGNFLETCHKIEKSFTFPSVDDYLKNGFTIQNHDFFLYAVANRSLDLTIDALGRDRVEEEVRIHQYLHRFAEDECKDQAIYPCSSNGTLQRDKSEKSCYFGDIGCGHDCVQRVLREQQKNRTLS